MADQHPRDLEKVLRDHTIVVPQDADLWALIGQHIWTEPVHSNTPPCTCRHCREGS